MLLRLQTQALGGVRAGQGRPLALVLACLLAMALAAGGDGLLPQLRLALFNAYQVHFPRQRASGPVQIIAIDEASLKEFGQWPWPRTRLTELIEHINAQQPLAIGLDILMPEPDTTSPEALAARLPAGPLRDSLAALPAYDDVLAAAMRRAPIVLGAAGFAHPEAGTSDALRVWPVHVNWPASSLPVMRFPQAMSSLPLLQAASRGQGLLSVNLEKGIVRRAPLVGAIGDTLAPALSMELLRVATGSSALEIEADADGVHSVSVGDLRVPTAPDGTVWVNFSAPAMDRYISALDVMRGRLADGALQNKIVIVAMTGLGLTDYKTNARGDFMPGVDTHAQMIESFFDGTFLRRPGWMRWAEVATFAACSLLLVWLLPKLRLLLAVPLGGALVLGVYGVGMLLFARAGLLFDATSVVCAVVLVGLSLLTSMLAAAVRDRKHSDRALQVARVSAAKTAGELGAARRIQMATLPQAALSFPGEQRFSLEALLEPAREVGGDLYDFFMLDRDRLFFMVGDVSGKGLPASLFMVVAKALSKSIALRGPSEMAAIMNGANRELTRENPEMLFVSSVAGILDASNGQVFLCNAGHDAPRRLTVDGRVEHLQAADGPPLCVMDDFEYPVQHYQLQAGECLCLTTDGINEAMNEAGDLYGNERLDRLLAALPAAAATPAALVQAVRDDVRLHVGQAEPSDDLTLLVLRWNGAA
ncbi:CHASE2 domain-containing protein [Duganella violaceipulchra]|uniref:CHASE2 domain-containing protein n=1 Tax=Duganella violaceipulchra TaxID=2849652 RepID=A0AA41L293_9BURK|nr:CHASE2 domain-containing protein [Duganella violaceicalia]MBV6322003.1 CHASE2 domain-containing protein [Duganella violaceicalia]MCP2007000.1 serine phosphatase RsbU (regulator of sigma subunit)/CHASE2 domain-containing sensor protein [Duganella violaceicalia]